MDQRYTRLAPALSWPDDNKRIEDFGAISECRADGEQPIDVWSVGPTRRAHVGQSEASALEPELVQT
jgi:hypothetical protein